MRANEFELHPEEAEKVDECPGGYLQKMNEHLAKSIDLAVATEENSQGETSDETNQKERTDMAIRSEQGIAELSDLPKDDVGRRFFTAHNNTKLIDIERKKDVQLKLQRQVILLARDLDTYVSDSREKSIALTKLEEVLMWTGKAIFKEED